MTAQYVTLTLDLNDGSGNQITQGYATFVPSVEVTGAGLVIQKPITATFRNTGTPPTVSLLAQDSPGLSAGGWTWQVTFTDVPGNPASFSFLVTFANGASQNLSAQAPVASITSVVTSPPGLSPSGDTTGATDTAAIQGLLNIGKAVQLQYGTFWINAPLNFPPGVACSGVASADPVAWGDATAGTVIKATSGFSGTSMLAFPDVNHAVTQGPTLANIALDGTLLPGTTDGIRATGPVNQARLRYVIISGVTGVGINCVNDPSAVGQAYPYGWDVQHVRVYFQGQQGIVLANHTDGTWMDVHVLGNNTYTSGHCFSISGPCPNSRFIACRAEWAGLTKDGFHLTGTWSSGTASGGMTFVGCSTDRNDNNGVFCNVIGTVPVKFTGCTFRRDGRNNANGGGGCSGVDVTAATIPLSFSNCSVFPGLDDTGAGVNSPQNGLTVANSSSVTWIGGYIQGATTSFNNGGGNTNLYVGPEVVLATGATGSPAIGTFQVLPASRGGTGLSGALAASFASTPTAPASTVSATLVMMGLGSSWAFTPAVTGIVMVEISGLVTTNTAVATAQYGGRFGIGAAPVNGVAVTGTRFGAAGDPSVRPQTAGVGVPFSLVARLALTPGTAYWFDLALDSNNASDAAQFTNLSAVITELPG